MLWQLRVNVNAHLKLKLKTQQRAQKLNNVLTELSEVPMFLVCLTDRGRLFHNDKRSIFRCIARSQPRTC